MENKVKENNPRKMWEQCLKWAREKDNDFRERCAAMGIISEEISLAQLVKLPLQANVTSSSAFSRLTLPLSGISRLLGNTPYLAEEMQLWAANSENWLRSCDVTLASVLLIADGFAGEGPAWGVLGGAEAMQATVVTLADRPWELIGEYGITACALTAPLLKKWIDCGESVGSCQTFFCLSNDLAEDQRQRWQEKLGAPIYRQWGLSGVQASVIAWECPKQQGYHWPMDSFWPEIIDSQTKALLPAGESGELVFTALQRRSTTAIRLRTGCYGHFIEGLCGCGSPWPRFIPKGKCI